MFTNLLGFDAPKGLKGSLDIISFPFKNKAFFKPAMD